MLYNYNTALTYDDVNIIPKFSNIKSRNDCDLTSNITKNYKLKLPIVASPMDTVVGVDMMVTMYELGGIAFLPRFQSIDEQIEDIQEVYRIIKKRNPNVNLDDVILGATVGVKSHDVYNAELLIRAGIKIILIDIAHGHCQMMKDTLESLSKLKLKYKFDIIAGNVATSEATRDLIEWGADGIRCGIGGGCFTPDMLVNTNNGLKKISDIDFDELVYSHTGILQKIIGKVAYKTKEDITIINDSIKCTSNHKIYVLNKKYIGIADENNIHKYAEWVPAKSLSSEYMLIELE